MKVQYLIGLLVSSIASVLIANASLAEEAVPIGSRHREIVAQPGDQGIAVINPSENPTGLYIRTCRVTGEGNGGSVYVSAGALGDAGIIALGYTANGVAQAGEVFDKCYYPLLLPANFGMWISANLIKGTIFLTYDPIP